MDSDQYTGRQWRVANALLRRHPAMRMALNWHEPGNVYVRLVDGWPGSGEGDTGAIIDVGAWTVHVHESRGRERGSSSHALADNLGDSELAEPGAVAQFVDRIEVAAQLHGERGEPPLILAPSPTSLVAQTITSLVTLGRLSEPFRVSQPERSGTPWWPVIRRTAGPLAEPQPGDPDKQPEIRFFGVERSDFRLYFETSTATAWAWEAEDDGYTERDLEEIEEYATWCEPHDLAREALLTYQYPGISLEIGKGSSLTDREEWPHRPFEHYFGVDPQLWRPPHMSMGSDSWPLDPNFAELSLKILLLQTALRLGARQGFSAWRA